MKKNKTHAYAMILPSLILMIVLVFYPILSTFSYSLQEMKLTEPENAGFIGIRNYIEVFTNSDFLYALSNSFVILLFVVVIVSVVGILISLLLNKKSRIQKLLIAIAIIPWALPPVVNGLLWRWIFHPSYGFLNKFLLSINLLDEPILWLSDRWSIIFITALVVAWRNIPFCAIIALATLKNIPKQLYESAQIDGSNKFQSFWCITLPLLLPSLAIITTTSSINAINVFDEIVSLAGYGDISKTLMIESYLQTFSFLDFGMGSAVTYCILFLASIVGLIYVKTLNKKVEYL